MTTPQTDALQSPVEAESAEPAKAPTEVLWQRWRDQRAAALDVPFGWLSLTDLIWLDENKTEIDHLPGTWWATDQAIVTVPAPGAEPQITPVAQGQSVTGATLQDGSQVEFFARSGRRGLRVRSAVNKQLDAHGLVPAAPYDAAWIKPVTVTWFEQPRPVIVGSAQPGLQHQTAVTGTVAFDHEGIRYELFVIGVGDAASVTFADSSPQTAAWRVLPLRIEHAAHGHTLLDFNFAQNYPSAFSNFGTCPAPVDGNTLPFAVLAGELLP